MLNLFDQCVDREKEAYVSMDIFAVQFSNRRRVRRNDQTTSLIHFSSSHFSSVYIRISIDSFHSEKMNFYI